MGCPLAQTHLGLLALLGYSNPPKNLILSWPGWPMHQDHGSVPSKLSSQCHWLLFIISPRTTRVMRLPATCSRADRVNSEPLPLPQRPKGQFYSADTGSQTKYGPSPLVSSFSLALCDGCFMCTPHQRPLPIHTTAHYFLRPSISHSRMLGNPGAGTQGLSSEGNQIREEAIFPYLCSSSHEQIRFRSLKTLISPSRFSNQVPK